MEAYKDPRVVLVHDWLTGMRGGEKCLEVLCERWPAAPLFTLLHRKGTVSCVIEGRSIFTSWLQSLPSNHRYYRYLLPLMPQAAARWQIPPCDIVISMSHCVAKAAPVPTGVPHVCYCFTPMRYAWHMRGAYFADDRRRPLRAALRRKLLSALREWDRSTAAHVTHFVAISATVQSRIRQCYGRLSDVIYPPVDTDFYSPLPVRREDYYLVLSAFAPYKRIDLAIEACNQLGRRLLVIGTGQEERRLRQLAGPTVQFLGWQPAAEIRRHLQHCRALLFPGEEDFGIVPVEAQACGAPVIGFGRGGITETVIAPDSGLEPTGLWFPEQTVPCLMAAMEELERRRDQFDPQAARRQAERFGRARFAHAFFAYLERVLQPAAAPSRRAA
jgi:glycosyltransferase involved in cell wall biosynthesis